MSMRKQVYEWNINRQVNGFPLTDPSQGTTFEQIAGIPFSIFTGGIGNNITMPAATTATQFVTIDSVRGSPSYFLSGSSRISHLQLFSQSTWSNCRCFRYLNFGYF